MVCPSTLASGLGAVGAAAGAANTSAPPRYALYFDQYHTTVLPNKTLTAGITHVITAFANSSLFTTDPVGTYTPFMNISDVRPMFDNGTKVCLAIGGWGDTEGFRKGLATEESRSLYASNIASTMDTHGFDCIDIDYEYPAGNGYDYKQVPNSDLVSEIETFPQLLSSIKEAIGGRELSIAVPGLERDMIAYTAESVPLINEAVDVVNVMSYDLLNRRDNFTKHHTDIQGSLNAVQAYLDRGFPPSKLNLGIAFYAKYFTLAANTTCTQPIGCPLALAEDAQGQDTGTSGAATFEATSFPVEVDPSTLTTSTDGSCGTGTLFQCTGTATGGACCSQYGFCGDTTAHCSTGCQSSYGTCTDGDKKTTAQSFAEAVANGTTDTENGGQWYVDSEAGLFWTFDTPELVTQKFTDIIAAKGLGGIMAWSLAEDSNDWSLLKAMQDGVKSLTASASTEQTKKIRRRRY
ncbi:glycosyl hydrolase family 18 [Diaporthe amygdali]|uniref:glycosyl hydrolase family 18 n=1 Tax=Phomopsis amygdali TaxID=1214568 RepID=UPI0022FF0D5C|nr:glycosyl hydrolase family 18 [Diaporthe amygdali]KAJ0115183.1 glycosyl hydrolase family 18 [Diaporthe amygdali]